MSLLSAAVIKILADMAEFEHLGEYENAEIVCDRLECWIGYRRVHRRSVNALERVLAVSNRSDREGVTRYSINGIGRAILVRPELASEIVAAVQKGQPFHISEGRVTLMEAPDHATGKE